MFNRAMQRRIFLSLQSLEPCVINLWHWPRSWFNLFASLEIPPTRVPAEWRTAMIELRRQDPR